MISDLAHTMNSHQKYNTLEMECVFATPLAGSGAPVASRYGWGAVPMLSVYDKGTGLPLLPWSEKVVATGLVESQSLVEDGREAA